MPADGTVRTRTETIARAIEGALIAIRETLRADQSRRDTMVSGSSPAPSSALADAASDVSPETAPDARQRSRLAAAYRGLQRASRLLPEYEPAPTDAAPAQLQLSAKRTPVITDIRGIDAVAVERLAAIGITGLDQIAGWEPDDVKTIAHALDLGRAFVRHDVVEQAKALLASARAEPEQITSDAVAGWVPKAWADRDPGQSNAAQLSEADLAKVREILRAGPRKSVLSALSALVPSLAGAVTVPDGAEDAGIEAAWDATWEAPWHPSPFEEDERRLHVPRTSVQTAGSQVSPHAGIAALANGQGLNTSASPTSAPAAVAAVAKLLAQHRIAELPEQAPALPAIALPTMREPWQNSRLNDTVASPPLHVASLDRIAAIDMEISALSAPSASAPSASAPSASTPSASAAPGESDLTHGSSGEGRAASSTSIATPSRPAERLVRERRMAPLPPEAEEADVSISVARMRPRPALKPLPELPLQPKRVAHLTDLPAASSGEVSEAAVVIVKRRARERAAPDLAFYKREPA